MGGVLGLLKEGGVKKEKIEELCGKKKISIEDTFWTELLHFEIAEEATLNSASLNSVLQQLSTQLWENNVETGNLNTLTRVVLSVLNSPQQNEQEWKTMSLNGLFLLRVFYMHFIQTSTSFKQLAVQLRLQTDSKTESKEEEKSPIESIETDLLSQLITFCVSPPNKHTYDVHNEAMNVLIVLLSSQIHLESNSERIMFFDTLLELDPKLASPSQLVHALLINFILQQQKPSNTEQTTYSLLYQLTYAASRIFMWSWSTYKSWFYSTDTSTPLIPSDTLANKSLLLLLILIHRTDKPNPFRAAFCSIHDTYFDPQEQAPTSVVPTNEPLKISFSSLYDTITQKLSDERTVLLLYFLLYGNPRFLSYTLSRTDLDILLLPLLQELYKSIESKIQHNYMILIVILILSHDSGFSKNIQNLKLPTVPWYKEGHLVNISLGSLCVLILVRTVYYNLSKVKDVFLHNNCLATLANLAPHVQSMHTFAALKLVKLFEMLSKRYNRIITREAQTNPAVLPELATTLPSIEIITHDPNQEIEKHIAEESKLEVKEGEATNTETDFYAHDYQSPELTTYSELVHMLLKILNSIFTHALQHNPHLVYAVLYQQNLFIPYKSHPRFGALATNIIKVIDHFNEALEKAQLEEWSPNTVLEVIKRRSLTWKPEILTPFIHLQFKYEQEENPDEFFTPCVWALVVHYSGLYWNPQSIRLFSVQSAQMPTTTAESEPEDIEVIDSSSPSVLPSTSQPYV